VFHQFLLFLLLEPTYFAFGLLHIFWPCVFKDPDSCRAVLTLGEIGVGHIWASMLAALARYCHPKSQYGLSFWIAVSHRAAPAVSSTGSRYTVSFRHSGSCYTDQFLQFVGSCYNSGCRESVVDLGFFCFFFCFLQRKRSEPLVFFFLFFCCFSNPFSIGECGGVNV
jgi:hypothetical protein